MKKTIDSKKENPVQKLNPEPVFHYFEELTEIPRCSKDPISLTIDGDFLRATGTTLGADNGIGVACGMAILDSEDIPHPPVKLLVTTEEETGMYGAAALKAEHLTGKAQVTIAADVLTLKKIKAAVMDLFRKMKKEFAAVDPDLKVSVASVDTVAMQLDRTANMWVFLKAVLAK
jgi:di/tripeptidase